MRSLAAPFLALISALSLAACASSGGSSAAFNPPPPRTAWVVGADGQAIGQANISEAPDGVLIRLEFSAGALTPGWHGAHFHGVGTCSDAAAGFQASTSHVGHVEGAAAHGLLNPAGPEAGDLPNLFAPAVGPFGAEFFTTRLTLNPSPADGRMPIVDADGSALVIHANADDHRSQPIGGAGARVGCAAFSALP